MARVTQRLPPDLSRREVQNPGFENTEQCVYLASPQVGTVGLLTN